RCVSGTVELLMNCEPAFDYHRNPATWEYSAQAYGEAIARSSRDPDAHPTLRLTTNLRLGLEGHEPRARTRMTEPDTLLAPPSSRGPGRSIRCRRPTTRPPTRCGRPASAGASGSTSATSPITRGGRICNAAR